MNTKKTMVAVTVGYLLASGGGLSALAQENSSEEQGQNLEEIVVTGSFLKRASQSDLPSPTFSFSSDAMQSQGFSGVQDITQNLTFTNGNISAPNLLADNSGIHSSVNLRGLGDASTLVLMNGKRVASVATDRLNNFYTDMRTLVPAIAMKNMDIVLDGAAALYGSDAVAGVVNVVTDRSFDGIKLNAQYNDVQGTDSTSNLEAMFGTAVGEKAHAVVAFSYHSEGLLVNGDRPGFAVPPETISSNGQPGSYLLRERPNNNGADVIIDNGVSGPINYSQLYDQHAGADGTLLVADPSCPVAGTGGEPQASFPLGRCRFNYHSQNTLRPSTDKVVGYSNFTYQINEDHTLKVDMSMYDAEHERSFISSFPVVRGGTVIPAENPYNVFGVDTDFVGRPFGINSPASITNYDQSGYRLVVGFDGVLNFANEWNYDVSLQRSQAKEVENTKDVDLISLQTALNGFGGSNCVTPIQQGATPTGVVPGVGSCQYYSPFGSEQLTNSPDMQDFILGSAGYTVRQDITAIDAVITGAVGDIGVAMGVHSRTESYDQVYNGLRESGRGGFVGINTNGGAERTVSALFAELSVPIGDTLEMQLAARYEDYERFTTTDPKVAILWKPLDFATFRASWGTAFRAPSLIQSLGTQTSTLLQNISDPVRGTELFVPIVSVNNPNLEPESSTNYNFGGTFNFGDSTTLNVDYWSYEFEDFITTEAAQGIVNANPFDPKVIRAAEGDILQVSTGFFNSGGLTTSGLDLRLDYSRPMGDGVFSAKAGATAILEYDIQALKGGSVIDGVGKRNLGFGRAAPEWKANLVLAYDTEKHGANVVLRYMGGIEDSSTGGQNNGQISSHLTVDAQYRFGFGQEQQYSVAVGALNLLDEEPPTAFLGFAPSLHDGLMRQLYVRLSAEF